MQYDFSPFFSEYEKLRSEADRLFQQVQEQYPQEVTCSEGCTSCCYALFDLTLVEAMYINRSFQDKLDEAKRKEILEKADQADRRIHRIKYHISKEQKKGKDTQEILRLAGEYEVPCPLLNSSDHCELYEDRPINCRIYGIPMVIGDQAHTCSRSGFLAGEKYPTVYMDRIQDRLMDISQRMVQSIPTQYIKLADVMVPLSMALMNEYNEDYLGIVKPVQSNSGGPPEWVLGKGED